MASSSVVWPNHECHRNKRTRCGGREEGHQSGAELHVCLGTLRVGGTGAALAVLCGFSDHITIIKPV